MDARWARSADKEVSDALIALREQSTTLQTSYFTLLSASDFVRLYDHFSADLRDQR
jgi:hypothetical protein